MAHRKDPEKRFGRELRKEMSGRLPKALFLIGLLTLLIALIVSGVI